MIPSRHAPYDGRIQKSALNDYIDVNRPDVTDEYGRLPLLASREGRYHYQSPTKMAYEVTRSCWYSGGAHDRSLEECEARDYPNYSTCPSSVSPHPIRWSSITHHLSEGVPSKACVERMSVSPETLDLHYDSRTKEHRRENGEEYLDDI